MIEVFQDQKQAFFIAIAEEIKKGIQLSIIGLEE